jgi:hypothetical protein
MSLVVWHEGCVPPRAAYDCSRMSSGLDADAVLWLFMIYEDDRPQFMLQ